MNALLWICLLSLINPAVARRTTGVTAPHEPVEEEHKPTRDLEVTHIRRNAVDEKVEILSVEKLVPVPVPVPIEEEVVDDLVQAIAAERKLQMTRAEGIKRTYKVPNKNYNNKKRSSSSSTKKKSSSSKASSTKKKSSKKRSTKKSRSSTATDEKKRTRKSRSRRKRKKSLFKPKKSASKSSTSKESKSKKRRKKSKGSSSSSKSKSGDQTCKGKEEVECRDDCIQSSCGFADNKMCVRKCKQGCCVSDSKTGVSGDPGESTAAPAANEGGKPGPEPTTLQPAAPVAITPAPTVVLPVVSRSCSTDVVALTAPGSLGCSPGGCCIVTSNTMQDVCNFQALSTAGVASTDDLVQIIVEEIDTSASGPFAIQAGCEISCTSQCRLS